ncbi:hypothetical protein LUPAC06_06126 [Micromonospora saelicesensis]|uniref:hypothetical protein n=1 Tax=Micromonospora saelicesensis TaxID=285676 RepID=UPI000DC01389|nr:hypothetical protein LUPAC06_06126 [Micromonospora saelicesensis]
MLSNEQIIGQALDRIEAGYVFPAKVTDIDAAIRRRLAAGEYDNLDGPALCETVTAHLQKVCPDKHLRLLWSDQPQSLDPADEDGGRAAFLALLRAENQGIRRVEHLDGNVGLIDVRRIAYADEGAAAIGAAIHAGTRTRRSADRVVAGELRDAGAVDQPADHQDCLFEAAQRPGPGGGAEPLPFGVQEAGQKRHGRLAYGQDGGICVTRSDAEPR